MSGGNILPKSVTPPCWNDDVRMNMLFSAFRSQTVNPAGWQDKMNFWVNLITDFCHQTKRVTFTLEDLCLTFERHGCVPQCLNDVIDHMINQSSIEPLADFNRIPSRKKSWLGWSYDVLLYRPVTWGLSTLWNAVNQNSKNNQYVVISVVKDLAAKVLNHHKQLVNSEWTDNIIYFEVLEEQCKNICTGMNLQMALTQLQKENEAVLIEFNGQRIVKFRALEETVVAPITDLDQGILRLQKAKELIQKEVDKVDHEIESCMQDAKNFVRNGLKTKAMMCLKRKKRLEKLLEKKIAALENADGLLCQLQNATSEKMVLQAYNAGVLAMKSAVKGGLDLDKIDTTMADVEEMFDLANEIQDTIAKPVGGEEHDPSELENELENLLAHGESTEALKWSKDDDVINELVNLPEPPSSFSPISKSKVSVPSKPSCSSSGGQLPAV